MSAFSRFSTVHVMVAQTAINAKAPPAILVCKLSPRDSYIQLNNYFQILIK
jgi:hypothetical protein